MCDRNCYIKTTVTLRRRGYIATSIIWTHHAVTVSPEHVRENPVTAPQIPGIYLYTSDNVYLPQ